MKKKKIERCCGNCCWFKFEDTDCDGTCAKHYWDINKEGNDPMFANCSNKACGDFVSHEEKLKHFRNLLVAKEIYDRVCKQYRIHKEKSVLLRRDALSFAINYIKTFNKL